MADCGIWNYAPIFGLFSCRCGERFETADEMDQHIKDCE